MAEGRRLEINIPADMEANYPDSVDSSPRSRETDSDYFGGSTNQRWEAVDQSGSSTGSSNRVRLMCSCGGKILPRPHDNQLTYVGGDTRILAVERSIRFSTMISKLSNVWGSGVSFKYQLPNEDLDSLISVTNDEDLDNMMAEYDRLQKSGYKFSRLRLFVFPNKPAEGSTSSLGSVLEEARREQWFVEALNNPPVNQGNDNRSECGGVSEASAWVNNMPDFLFGLENSTGVGIGTGIGIGIQRNNGGGAEEERIPIPLPRPSSFNSDAVSASARIESGRAQIGTNPVSSDQTEKGGSRNSNSGPSQEIGGIPKQPNLQQEINITEMTINRRPPTQQIPPQVPLQEFQNLQFKHQQQEQQIKYQEHQYQQQEQQIKQQEHQYQQQEYQYQQQEQQIKHQEHQYQQQEQHIKHQDHQLKQQDHQLKQQQQQQEQQQQDSMPETVMGRKIYTDPARNPGQEIYMQQPSQPDYYRQEQQHQQQQPSQPDYYRQEQQQQQQQPVTYRQEQQLQQQQPVAYRQEQQQQQQQPVAYWQMHDQSAANSQYPVYLLPAGSNMLQTMAAVRPGPTPGYYNPAQRVNTAPPVYDAPGLVTTVRGTVQRQQQQPGGVSEVAAVDPYREQPSQTVVMPLQPPPVSKVPAMYGSAMQVPVGGDVRMMYRATAPVNSMPIPHPEAYAYPPQQVVYDPNMNAARQMYYTQALNPQYPPMGPIASASDVSVAPSLDMAAVAAPPVVVAAAAPEQQVKLVRVSQATTT